MQVAGVVVAGSNFAFARGTGALLLDHAGLSPLVLHLGPEEAIYRQGEPSSAVFYLKTGRAKVTVASAAGREATIFLVAAGDFVGEEAIIPSAHFRQGTATTITSCTVLVIERDQMIRAVHEGGSVSAVLLSFLVVRSLRVQADLVDLLCNSSERRLARDPLVDGRDCRSCCSHHAASRHHPGNVGRDRRHDKIAH